MGPRSSGKVADGRQGSARSSNDPIAFVGQGVPRDNVRAYMWFNLAAAKLTNDGLIEKMSVDLRDGVAGRMTPAQVAEARRLSLLCQAQQFKGC